MHHSITIIGRFGAIATFSACLISCASPTDRLLKDNELEPEIVQGVAFEHLVVHKQGSSKDSRLHVYNEGDGTPWMDGNVVAIDPTPKNPLALRLMLRDRNSSVYVGRPCYFGVMSSGRCESEDWTFGRYSEHVVESMASAIGRIVAVGGYQEVRLIGYSGGGVIALLAANRVPETTSVVTVAANLDTDEWTRTREFLPLHNSLNPADVDPLLSGIVHVQLAGELDQVVPLSVTESFRRSGHRSELWLYADFDHRCCWEDAWPEILERLDSRLGVPRVSLGERTHARHRKCRAPAQ